MKRISAREFQHGFGALSDGLQPGETVQVTKRGKAHGFYQRAPSRNVARPDFLKRLEDHPYPEEVGDEVVASLYEAVS